MEGWRIQPKYLRALTWRKAGSIQGGGAARRRTARHLQP